MEKLERPLTWILMIGLLGYLFMTAERTVATTEITHPDPTPAVISSCGGVTDTISTVTDTTSTVTDTTSTVTDTTSLFDTTSEGEQGEATETNENSEGKE